MDPKDRQNWLKNNIDNKIKKRERGSDRVQVFMEVALGNMTAFELLYQIWPNGGSKS